VVSSSSLSYLQLRIDRKWCSKCHLIGGFSSRNKNYNTVGIKNGSFSKTLSIEQKKAAAKILNDKKLG
jgi:hypothetical protein